MSYVYEYVWSIGTSQHFSDFCEDISQEMLESNPYPHSILTWTTTPERLCNAVFRFDWLLTSINLLSDCSLFTLGDWEGNNILDWGGGSSTSHYMLGQEIVLSYFCHDIWMTGYL